MATATATVWEQEQVAPCYRCGEATKVGPDTVAGVVVAGGVVCGDCYHHLLHIGEWGEFLARLTRPAGDGDGDGDGPDGGPAAPAARTLWLIVGGQSVARELSPDEEAELVEFVEACHASTPDPEPCITCGRPASPYEATPAGPLCFRCWPDPSPRPSTGPARTAALVAVC